MKQAMIAWLAARFVEKSSAAGLGVMISSGIQEYQIIHHAILANVPVDSQSAGLAAAGFIGGAAAFIMKDGHVLEVFGLKPPSAGGK